MQALILAAVLSTPVDPACQQWQERIDRESRHAARLVWSPQKERHIRRMNYAMQQADTHCADGTESMVDSTDMAAGKPMVAENPVSVTPPQ